MGNQIDGDNRNIDTTLLAAWLAKQGVEDALVTRALHELNRVSTDTSKSIYDRNHEVYELLRYGVKVLPAMGENKVTVWLIDWKRPQKNHFAIAEEVTVRGANAKASTKRPDVVIYINGIVVAVLELKRSTVSVAEGIRQNLDNQKKEFIQPFSRPCSGSWRGTIPRGCVTRPSRHQKNTTCVGLRKLARMQPSPICWIAMFYRCAKRRACWT
ncbi:hypothetical protein LP420_04310 [Massilia sp. B-10]|nr:hypothetical protein LP420_04310 [Massilia sp. B-10]